jgi:hypothetical protein
MTEPVALKHRAFISYGHADTTQVNWLHRGLEGFRIDSDLVGRDSSVSICWSSTFGRTTWSFRLR